MHIFKQIIKAGILLIFPLFQYACTKNEDAIDQNHVEKWTYFNTANGLLSNKIQCIAEDSSHNIWMGTDKGLMQYDGKGFKSYTTKSGLPSDVINSIFCSSKSELFIGTNNGFGKIVSNQYKTVFHITNLQCLKFCENKDGNIYCTTNIGLLFYLSSTGVVTTYTKVDSTLSNGVYKADPIYDIAYDNDHDLWLAGSKGIYIYVGQKKYFNSNRSYGFSNRISGLFKDRKGNIWIAPSNGSMLVYFNGAKYINDTIMSGNNNYLDIVQDKYDNFWISIAETGVLNYGGGFIKVYTKDNSDILSNNINAVLCDSKGNIWFASDNAGLMLIENLKPLQYQFGPNSNTTIDNHSVN